MYHLRSFHLRDMTACGAALRMQGTSAADFETVAERLVRYLYASLTMAQTQESACVLVRLFKTTPFCRLTPELQDVAVTRLGRIPDNPSLTCLTLIATRGRWNPVGMTLPAPAASGSSPLAAPMTLPNCPCSANSSGNWASRSRTFHDLPTRCSSTRKNMPSMSFTCSRPREVHIFPRRKSLCGKHRHPFSTGIRRTASRWRIVRRHPVQQGRHS